MNPLTVIIPSRNATNLKACVEAVRDHEPRVRIIVVDDGLEPTMRPEWNFLFQHWAPQVLFIRGIKSFVFARNCNLGIRDAMDGDVVLLNDDALLQSSGGFSRMQEAAEHNPKLAIVSATTNVSNSEEQWPRKSGGVRTARPKSFFFAYVAFVCVLIPRRTIETIGLLDERFTAYGWEDVDYCRRVHDAGLKIGIDDRCFVDHSKLTSTFRGSALGPGKIEEGRQIYLEKWGRM